MNGKFELDPRLAAETVPVGDLPLSRVLLRDDRRFLWLVLSPRAPGMRDLIDLTAGDQTRLMREIDQVARAARDLGRADKLNIASLGNMVAQLHVHVIARRRTDIAWPLPVWGVGEAEPYPRKDAEETVAALRDAIGF